jgi:hypothetical protein
VEESIIGSNNPALARAPFDTGIGMGNFAKYILVIPSLNTTVVTMGHTYGKSSSCPGAYDDAFSL